MARTLGQKQAFVNELRGSAMRLGATLGLLAGVWWGFKHPEHVNRCSTQGPANAVLSHCTSHTLATVAVHWAVILGVGFAIGGLVGVAVASLIRTPKHA